MGQLQFFLGFSNKTYGTLTGGRVNALSLDGLIAYDPMGQRLRLLAIWFHRHVCRLQRHGARALQHRD